uniref:Uncharacterized protein n=1 Tax=Arundo donax TaxID=35708 RepID=A0A0A9BZV9_ARUDO
MLSQGSCCMRNKNRLLSFLTRSDRLDSICFGPLLNYDLDRSCPDHVLCFSLRLCCEEVPCLNKNSKVKCS